MVRYVWADVKVLDYDAKKRKFLVQVLNNPNLKYVGRLSLMFHEEDPDKFKKRIDEAKERQLAAEDEMRFYRYVDSIPSQSVCALPLEVRKGRIAMYNI